MLPDYPALKTQLHELLDRFLQQRVAHHQGLLGRVGRHRIFEGDKTFLRRSSSDTETNNFTDFSGSRTLSAASIGTMTFVDVLRELDALAAEMAAKTSKHFFEGLDRTLEAAGQVDDAKGEKISPALILRMLERIEMDFDAAGQHHLSIVIHPSKTEAFAAALRELDEDSAMRERHRDIIERKREEWRVREASRRLVG
jgi:hypothetical protein